MARARRRRRGAGLADHPRGPPADRAREPGQHVRRRRDRPDARPEHPRDDRRGARGDAGRGPAHPRDPRADGIDDAAGPHALTREADGAMSYWEELERPAPDTVTVDGIELRS